MTTESNTASSDVNSISQTATPAVISNSNSFSFGHPLSSALTVKLDEKNYILWKQMVIAILRGQKLDGYILGTKAQPSQFLPSPNNGAGTDLQTNPEFEAWVTTDQSLLGWLYASMTQAIASEIVIHKTSREVWRALEVMYGTTNCARINQLKASLQGTRKNNMRMAEYLALMKQISNNLSLAGEPVEINSLTSSVLAGLDSDYLPVICQINNTEDITWQSLYATLLTFENTLIHMNVISGNQDNGTMAANLAFNHQNNTTGNNNFRAPNSNYNRGQNHSNNNNQRGNFRPRERGSRGGGRSNNSKPTCQVCSKYGHSAAICYFRYDESYTGNNGANNENNNRAAAFVATPDSITDPNWLTDSGATNHLTPDISNLNIRAEYTGNEAITVGQGHREGAAVREP